jgi:type I restriction enzyme S subunit
MKPGYKQTEVGVIPEEWKVKSLADIIALKHGFAFSSVYFSKSGPIVLTPGNFRLEGGLYFEERNTKRYSGSYSAAMTFRKGDLLIVMTDLTPDCNLLGKPAFVESDEVILHNQRIGLAQLNDQSVSLKLLYYLFLSRPYLDRIKEQATGSTVRHTSNKSIYSVKLACPPLTEQRAIAEALSDVDGLLGGLDRLIAKKRDLKQAAMQQLLTGQTRLPGFHGEWEVKRLGQVAHLQNGYAFKSETYNPIGDFKIITIANVQDGFMEATECSRIDSLPSDLQPHQRLQAGDILISMTGNVGRVCRVNELKCLLNQRVGKLITIGFDSKLLFFILGQRRFIRSMATKAKGGAQGNLSVSDITEFEFPAPRSESEQTAIAQILTDMDAELTALEQRRDKTRALKQAMMQELLTGRTRLV